MSSRKWSTKQSEEHQIQEQMAYLIRRRNKLEQQLAIQHINADPSVLIQIEDLNKDISNLRRRLSRLTKSKQRRDAFTRIRNLVTTFWAPQNKRKRSRKSIKYSAFKGTLTLLIIMTAIWLWMFRLGPTQVRGALSSFSGHSLVDAFFTSINTQYLREQYRNSNKPTTDTTSSKVGFLSPKVQQKIISTQRKIGVRRRDEPSFNSPSKGAAVEEGTVVTLQERRTGPDGLAWWLVTDGNGPAFFVLESWLQ